MITEVKSENIFYCPGDEVAFTSTQTEKTCNVCGQPAMLIGFFESDGGEVCILDEDPDN